MNRTLAVLSLAVLLAAAPPARAGSAADPLRKQIADATQHDNAQGANVLCGALGQAVGSVRQFFKNRHACREWEELLAEAQASVGRMRSPEAEKVFVMALRGMDPMAQMVVALGLKEHPASSDVDQAAIQLLKSTRDFQVQVACMELLGAHKCADGLEEILKQLKPTNIVALQIASSRALAQIGDPRAVEPLIEYLRELKGSRMRFEAVAALRAITGQNFTQDAGTWAGWWEKNKATFTKPNTIAPVFNYELEQKSGPAEEEVTYYEIPIVENRVVFIVDISGSMQLGGDPNRLERAKTQLKDLVERLGDKTLFNIILYSNAVKRWMNNPVLVPASAANKKLAKDFLDEARPGGGTETTWALEEALREVSLVNGVETVFLLSDGAPQPMRHSNVTSIAQLPKGNTDIRKRIEFINQTLKVRINTIGVYTRAPGDPAEQGADSMKAFLEGIAKDNDGVYKEVN
ncbi:MAG: VWA domain-containing protein [Planctomycetota bacterium]|nr:VWA domain-containing protein [Planctomycetota bacterium]